MIGRRNYFNEPDFHHSIKKFLKRHHDTEEEKSAPSTKETEKLRKLVSDSKELSAFIHEFPRKSHIQKLSSYLTPMQKHTDLEKKVDSGIFLTKEKGEKNFPTVAIFNDYKDHTDSLLKKCEDSMIQMKAEMQEDMVNIKNSYTTKEVTEELIDSVDAKEVQLKELINQIKQDLENKLSPYETNWTAYRKWYDEMEAFRKAQVTGLVNVGLDIKKLDKKLIDLDNKALYAATFYTIL